MENNYYIYQYICAEKGMAIYVGKGKGDRALDIKGHYDHCPELKKQQRLRNDSKRILHK